MTVTYYTTATVSVNITAGWTDISSYVLFPLHGSDGFSGTAFTNRVAAPGNLSVRVTNEAGKFTVGGATVLAGFKKGVQIKLDIVYDGFTHNVFFGTVDQIKSDRKAGDLNAITLTCIDWL